MTLEKTTPEFLAQYAELRRNQACKHVLRNNFEFPIFKYRQAPECWTQIYCAACAQHEIAEQNRSQTRRYIGFDFGEARTWEEVTARLKGMRKHYGRDIWFGSPTLATFRTGCSDSSGVHPEHDEADVIETRKRWYENDPTPAKFHLFIEQTPYTQYLEDGSDSGELKWSFTAVRLMAEEELEPYRIFATLAADWTMIRIDRGRQTEQVVPAGRYELERIPNPFGHKAPWLVRKEQNQWGNVIGMAETFWLCHSTQVELLETDVSSPNFGKRVDHGKYGIRICESGDYPRMGFNEVALMAKK
jgi:hypothetical protein